MSGNPTIEPYPPEVESVGHKDLTDWALLRSMSDEEAAARAADDPDAQPTDADFWKNARVTLPPGKTRISLDLDNDLLAWFKAQGRAYGQRINEALRSFVEQQQGGPPAAGEVAEPTAVYDAPSSDREPPPER